MDYGYLNVASLLLGIAAIIFPLTQNRLKTSTIKIIISFSLSLIAIGCQIGYQNHLVNIQDWSAIADTMGSLLSVSTILIVLTILLNLFSLLKIKKKNSTN